MRTIIFWATVLCLLGGGATHSTRADAPEKQSGSLPKVLIFGDSISGGYSKFLIQALEGKAEVIKLGSVATYRINEQAFWRGSGKSKSLDFGSAKACVADYDRFKEHLDEVRYDVIHFNFGLNDSFRGRGGKWHNPVEQYAKDLDTIVKLLKTNGATIIWSNTTPIPVNDPHRPAGDDLLYNAAAEKVMQAHGIPINDLHSVVTGWEGFEKWRQGSDVHFNAAVSTMLAADIAEVITEAITAPSAGAGPAAEEPPAATGRWSVEKAQAWYDAQPWPCGFNYIPAHAISYTEMWMPDNFDPAKMDRELALARGIGFNCLRVVLPFVVWEHDPSAFKERFEAFLKVCDKHGLKVMPCFFDDCAFGSEEKLKNPWYGPQPEVLEGWYASGWTPSPGHDMVRDPQTWPRLEKYVTDIMTTFKNDPRVWVWDLYNEPGNANLGEVSVPLAEQAFRWARAVNPAQPLTLGQWNDNENLNAVIFSNSDIITFHNYGGPKVLARHIERLKKHKRPVINTEWLNRSRRSTVAGCLPLFASENVGCLHWGLVNGKTQTHLGWGWRPGKPAPELWQHDLFHGDHRPYDPSELSLFKQTIAESLQ